MVCSPPGFSVHGILQVRNWSGLPFPSPGHLPDPGIRPRSPALLADSLLTELWGKPHTWGPNRNPLSPLAGFSSLEVSQGGFP